jgi:hypothetical protein
VGSYDLILDIHLYTQGRIRTAEIDNRRISFPPFDVAKLYMVWAKGHVVSDLCASDELATGEKPALSILEEMGLVLGVARLSLHDTAKASSPATGSPGTSSF